MTNEVEQWFQSKIDAVDFWMKGEYPHYLATCGGKPTAEGFNAYLDERLAADPEQKKLIEDGLICCGIRAVLDDESDESAPMTVMTSTELLERLGRKRGGTGA
jgi:hypothetical protein